LAPQGNPKMTTVLVNAGRNTCRKYDDDSCAGPMI
jgi:hypothetical protein